MNRPYWTPPEGMLHSVEVAWKAFFRVGLSGRNGYVATPDMYLRLYKVQYGRCAICAVARGINPEDPKGRGAQRLGWDHNHATGAVRGLLCTRGEWSCNRLVGRFRDNPAAWQRGADYLRIPPALALADCDRPDPVGAAWNTRPIPQMGAVCCHCRKPRSEHGGPKKMGACPGESGIQARRFAQFS